MVKVKAIQEVVKIPAPRPPTHFPNNPAEIVLKRGKAKTKRYIDFMFILYLKIHQNKVIF